MENMAAADREDLLDLDGLLQPISEESPAGSDPRLDVTPQSLYFRLRDARSEARAAERVADNDPAADTGGARHWLTVRELGVEALAGTGKDIEIAAWLTESLVRTDGLAGLMAGARLITGLASRYWTSGLFPTPDEDGIAGRVAPVAGLSGEGGNGTLLQPLRKLVLFDRADGTPLTYWRFEQAEEVEVLDPARKAQRLAAGVAPLAELEAEAKSIGRDRLAGLHGNVVLALQAWRSMDEALTAVAGADAPPTGRVLDLLDKLRRTIERYAPPAEAVPEVSEAPDAMDEAPVEGTPARAPADRAATREEMLQQISRIAAYFRINEPHSPLSYTLDDAVRRARLGLPDLLKEMMPELAARATVLSGLGIRPPEE
jgi:type VI secretion system protein ImpA